MISIEELIARYPSLSTCRDSIEAAVDLMLSTYRMGGKILLCGNGGSCADCDHIVGELMKGFLSLRPLPMQTQQALSDAYGARGAHMARSLQRGIPAISLPAQQAVITAFANDVDAELIYAQLLQAYAQPNDLLIGISTSGNAKNVSAAMQMAKLLSVKTLGLTGEKESVLSALADCCIRVPACETYKIQELHLPVYHYLCARVEELAFGG